MAQTTPLSGRVLVLDADMAPALAIARSLRRAGLVVDVASATADAIAAYSNAVAATLYYPDPLHVESNFIDWLAQCVAEKAYALVIPVTERTVIPLASHRARFNTTCLAIASDTALVTALDKSRTLDVARELKIPAPRTTTIEHIDQLDQSAAGFAFPIVIKPARSFGTRDNQRTQLSVDYAFNANELRAKTIHALRYGSALLQEYIDGQGVGIELIADHGNIVYAFQHRRLHEVPLSGGGSSLRMSEAVDLALLDASRKLMQAMGWHGVAMVEFKRNPTTGTFSLMEINGRFWGSLPLAVAAGADFPAMLFELLIEGAARPRLPARLGVYGRHLARDLYWAELVLRREGPASLVDFPPRVQILKDALLVFSPRHHFDIQQWRDPKPGIVDLARIVRAQFDRLARILAERRLARRLAGAWQSGEVARRLASARRVLFVCYGNINRSPLAERCFSSGPAGMQIACSSAGFHEEEGRPADPGIVAAAKIAGIDMNGAASRCINRELVDSADIVFVMEYRHYGRITEMFPEAGGRTYLLSPSGEIDDPYGKSPEAYEQCTREITTNIRNIESLLARLRQG